MCFRAFETRSHPRSLAATHHGFYVDHSVAPGDLAPATLAALPSIHRDRRSRRVLCHFSQSSVQPSASPSVSRPPLLAPLVENELGNDYRVAPSSLILFSFRWLLLIKSSDVEIRENLAANCVRKGGSEYLFQRACLVARKILLLRLANKYGDEHGS
jgi:hypothetical protein